MYQRVEGSVAYSQVSNRVFRLSFELIFSKAEFIRVVGTGSSNPFRDGLRERQFRGVGGSGGDRRKFLGGESVSVANREH